MAQDGKLKVNKITGSLIGLAIGDAMGAPYEFKTPPYEIAHDYVRGGVHNVTIGEWTDDTSMALCLAQSLIDHDGFSAKDQMDRYLAWYEEGYFSTREECFDIGNTVASALMQYKTSQEPYSGIKGDKNSGNGSLMRLAPIALKYYDDKEKLIEYAAKSSQTTHQSELAVDACIFYAQLIAGAIRGDSKEKILSQDYTDATTLREEVRAVAKGSHKESRVYKPTGYVIATLETALHAFYRFNTFEEGLLYVIALGYDADTVGAVYGELAGAYYGYDAIPQRWKLELMQHDTIYTMAEKLIHLTKNSNLVNKDILKHIHILVGDITSINTEVIVNAANYRLLGGGGVDGAIHKAGGAQILKECKILRHTQYPDGLPVGEAVITSAGNLKAKYVIHTVGPKYRSDKHPEQKLISCYKKSLLLADQYQCASIAFPAIATGIYGYPKNKAAKIAYMSISSILETCHNVKDVVFVFYTQEDAEIFRSENDLDQIQEEEN